MDYTLLIMSEKYEIEPYDDDDIRTSYDDNDFEL